MSDEPKILTLDIPQREGKEGYVGTIFSLYLRLGGVLAEANFKDSDPRVYLFMKLMIGLIPGVKNRAAINEKMEEEIAKIRNDLNDEEKSRKRNQICLNYIGNIHDFVDKHIGVSSENKIGFAVKPRS